MNKFIRNLLTEWRKLELPFSNQKIIIAVSGGADSVSLALALYDLKKRKKLNSEFIIAHFNHNLRGIESKGDSLFVKDLAKTLGFKFIQKIQNPKSKIQNQKGNLEQNARNSRYKFLEEVVERTKSTLILTAHTKNDQAETLLLNLIRGSGLDGLGGIPSIRRQNGEGKNKKSEYLIVRPLINWASRVDTEKFCHSLEVNYRLDSMNDDLIFSRIKIRKEIIPLLEKINPRVVDTLANTANYLRQEAEELKIDSLELAENLSQKELKLMSKSRRMRVLRNWLKSHRGDLRQLDLKHFEALEELINSRKSGRIIELPRGQKVVKRDGKIFFEK